MDHNELKASERESNYKHPSSPMNQIPSAKPNSLSDTNVGMKKQEHDFDRGTKSCEDEKYDHVPFPACAKGGKVDKQCVTESSSSNTPHVSLPASSNDSCQETSLEIQSCKLGKVYETDPSTCAAVGSSQPGKKMNSLDDKVERSISHAKQCNTVKGSETIEGFRTRNSDDLSGVRSSDNLSGRSSEKNYAVLVEEENKKATVGHAKPDLRKVEKGDDVALAVAKEADQEFEASGSSSFRVSYADSIGSGRTSCVTETGSVSQQSRGQEKSFSFCSAKEAAGTRPLARNESSSSDMKDFFPETRPKVSQELNDGLHWQRLSSQTSKDEGLSSHDRAGDLSRIDLNEDVLDHDERLGKESVPNLVANVSKPKPVMAKPGTSFFFLQSNAPNNRKSCDWTGSGADSAFRPTSTTKNWIENKAQLINDGHGSEKHRAFKSIDLNLDAVADCELESNTESSPKQERKLDFDLNCLGENDDNNHLSCPKTSLPEQSVRNFDLNDNLVPVDTCNDAYQRGKGTAVSSVQNSKPQDFQSFRPAFPADFRSLPGFIPGHYQPFLVAPPNILHSSEQLQRVSFLQPQLAYAPSPPHAFRVDPKDGLSASVVPHNMLSYMIDPHTATIMSQVMGSGGVPGFPGHVFQVPHGSSANHNIAFVRPNVAVETINRGANPGQPFAPLTNPTLEDQMSFQQVGVSASGVKRREPEGGWDSSNQLRFAQMASWH